MEAVEVPEEEPLPVTVGFPEADTDELLDTDAVVDTDGLVLAVTVVDALEDTDEDGLLLAELETVFEDEAETVFEAETEFVAESVAVLETVFDAVFV
jgi:hypothetical protein